MICTIERIAVGRQSGTAEPCVRWHAECRGKDGAIDGTKP